MKSLSSFRSRGYIVRAFNTSVSTAAAGVRCDVRYLGCMSVKGQDLIGSLTSTGEEPKLHIRVHNLQLVERRLDADMDEIEHSISTWHITQKAEPYGGEHEPSHGDQIHVIADKWTVRFLSALVKMQQPRVKY
ncbi:hypothetical protein HO173_004703 [Letharia columbiana]|uniref:Uncharacterized protein n=1 Tax=Letharia columbiana TaxID=112416 RepID=A0A8H6FYG2_9LECA|nr:uncharacterized protein HO173_004703 [Letharia columbiana]KAF6237235.1 hypothetical protein HO173_004703 [Letharia columbiana]